MSRSFRCHFFFLALLLSCLLSLGCQSLPKLFSSNPEERAEEIPVVFSSLPEGIRRRLLQGIVRLGDSPDMVYIAWGEPDSTVLLLDEDGTTKDVWTYVESADQPFSRRRHHRPPPPEKRPPRQRRSPPSNSLWNNEPRTYQQAVFVDEAVSEITLRSNRPVRPRRRH